jgi:glycosyltransferase involved in cell wall biosynthesis
MNYLEKTKFSGLRSLIFSLICQTNYWLNKRYPPQVLPLQLKAETINEILNDKITTLSIIITTRNRLSALKNYSLPSLEQLRFNHCPYEIVIIDNNSTDNTATFLKAYAQTNPLIKIGQEKKPGISAGRNRGIQIAHGEILIFIDDDCEVDPLWLDRLYNYHIRKPYFLGQGQIYDLVFKKNLIGNYPLGETVAGGNLSIRKKIFDYVSFNEQIIFSHDDTDLIRQIEILWPNYPHFVDETPIKHHRAPSTDREINGNYNSQSLKQSEKMYSLTQLSELTLKRNLDLKIPFLGWHFWLKESIFLLLESVLYRQDHFLIILKTKLKIYRQLKYLKNKKTRRYVSFTFDDGLINSAKKIDQILSPHQATFYIVTGWLKPKPLSITDPPNIKPDHGNPGDWQRLANLGHEIGSHTVSHPETIAKLTSQEYAESLTVIKQFHSGPYSLATPHLFIPTKQTLYEAVRAGEKKEIYNSLGQINFNQLNSWDPIEKNISLLCL